MLPLPRLLRHCVLTLALLLTTTAVALGDVLLLRDGTRVEGAIRRVEGGYTVTQADGSVVEVRDQDVAGVEITGTRTGAPARRDERLASLQRAVENIDDLAVIISRYERFIQMNADSPAAEEAREQLEQYRDYQERGLVRHQGRWVTPEERDELLREAFLKIAQIRRQIKDADVTAARESLRQMLAGDPENVSALYLLAVLDLRAGDLPRARSLLERVRAREPGHAPTLVNLAAINLQQNRHPRALAFLQEAMEAAPGNRQVLDNVAEALNLLPADERNSRIAERVRQMFLGQDAALRQEMAGRGLYRWGSTWVPREQYERLSEIEQEIRESVTRLEREHQALQRDIATINLRMEENERYMQRLDAGRTYIDQEGRIHQGPLPPAYYDAQRQQHDLATERTIRQRELQRVAAEAAQQQQRYPTPPYRGRLEIVGEDGVPVRLPGTAPEPVRPPGEQLPPEIDPEDEDDLLGDD